MARNVKSYYTEDINRAYYTGYPVEPKFNNKCITNTWLDTLDNRWPRSETIMGPTSLKHIYTNVPNYYPPQNLSRPIGTMYDVDLSRFGAFGKRETYGFQAYPYHHYSPKEVREYEDHMIPVLNLFDLTQYHTLNDGAFGR